MNCVESQRYCYLSNILSKQTKNRDNAFLVSMNELNEPNEE